MNATHLERPPSTPERVGDTLTTWMSHADACDNCPNTQPPRAAMPIVGRAGWFTASYECADCGQTWAREFAGVC